MPRNLALALALTLVPATAIAKQVTTWDFRGEVPGRWEIVDMAKPQPTTRGLRLFTGTEGHMRRDTTWTHTIDTVEIIYTNDIEAEAMLLWHLAGTPEAHLVELPFLVESTSEPKTVALPVSNYAAQWDGRPDKIGLAVPAGMRLTVREMRFVRHNVFERLWQAWLTFWTFDRLKGHSVNFLWGPQLAVTSAERFAFTQLKPWKTPATTSANGVLYVLLLIAIAWYIVWPRWRRTATTAKQWQTLGCICLGLWIFYDVRMGAEVISYLHRDYAQYWSKPMAERTYRGRGDFYAFTQYVDLLRQEDSYVFMHPATLNYHKALRYMTYPSLPLEYTKADGQQYWLIYDRPDVKLSTQNQLVLDGQPISPPGTVVSGLGTKFILFQTQS